MNWSSTNATDGSFDNGIGPVALSGSVSVAPSVSTTYVGTFNGPGGPAVCGAVLTVGAAAELDPLTLLGLTGLALLSLGRRFRVRGGRA